MNFNKEKVLFSLFVTRPMWGIIPARITVGTMLVLHGLGRLLSMQADPGTFLYELPGPVAIVILVLFSILELLGGVMIIAGFLSRIASFTIIVEMALSIFTERIPLGFQGDVRLEVLIFAMCTMIFFSGSGRYSVDRWIARRMLKKTPNKKWEHYCIAETPYCERWYE
ncbi:MAG: DoxX family protein [Patescibacteria group bacterium]